MQLINNANLNTYVYELADALDWRIEYHAQIYQEVAQQKNIGNALELLDNRIRHWFIRGGWMSPDWKLITEIAVKQLNYLNYCLLDLAEASKLSEVVEILKPLGRIKRVKSGNENFMPASKILNFLFPGLIPKIDTFWIKGVCLNKLNHAFPRNRFITTGPIDLQQYKDYLQFASEKEYENSVLNNLKTVIGIEKAYAVAFEYCLLGYSKEEILDTLNIGKTNKVTTNKTVSSTETKKVHNNLYGIDFHRSWLRNENLKLIFDQMRESIKAIGNEIQENPVYSYVGYKFRGELIGWIIVYRNSIEIGTYIVDRNKSREEEKLRVRSLQDDYSAIISAMKSYYIHKERSVE